MRFWKPKQIDDQPLVRLVVASYLNEERVSRRAALHCLLHSLRAQTYANWNLTVVHDGPCDWQLVLPEPDARIEFLTTPRKIGHFGHKYRRRYALEGPGDVIGFTNDDNYYAPTYLEWMLHTMQKERAEFVYCDMVHSHQMWKPFKTEPKYRKLDLGGFLVKRRLVENVPWTDFSFKGDGTYINALVAKARRTAKVNATLFVHN